MVLLVLLFDGERYDTGNSIQTLIKVLNVFQYRFPDFMEKFASCTRTNRRQLVARRPEDLYSSEHLVRKYSKPLGNGWWLGSNNNADYMRDKIRTACEVAGVSFGRQLQLLEE